MPMRRHPKLPYLSNKERSKVEKLAKSIGIPLDTCPTCQSKPIEVSPDVYGWENGTFQLFGKTYPCDCQNQMELRKHYLLAGIGDQYMRLNWDKDFTGDPDTIEYVKSYLDGWESFRLHGMGVEFASPKLGVGKTFAATHIAKYMIKQGEKVQFVHFKEVINSFEKSNAEEIEEKFRSVTYLILDEVTSPVSAASSNLFSSKLEDLVRHRTNFNLPTIMTTNLTQDELLEAYPRSYSLLAAKQLRIPMKGDDKRIDSLNISNLDLALNNEVRPIS